jgi:hypothetical protein
MLRSEHGNKLSVLHKFWQVERVSTPQEEFHLVTSVIKYALHEREENEMKHFLQCLH